jgi:DHA1 family multidrug resistance protein-like MFS transporter
LKGRRLPVIIASLGFGIFMIAVAVSKDIQTLLICRFFAGLFGSCALTIVPAIFSDIFNNETRGMAIAAFAASVFNGPLVGPM